jgi:hypothetical protein
MRAARSSWSDEACPACEQCRRLWLLDGRQPRIPGHSVCEEGKRRGTAITVATPAAGAAGLDGPDFRL